MKELFIAFGILTALLWLVIGWRAMRAHEKIAKNLTRYLDALNAGDPHDLRRENGVRNRNYRKFLQQNPDAEKLSAKERHEQFRNWLKSNGDAEPEE